MDPRQPLDRIRPSLRPPNLWVQPLDGSSSRQLTHFTDGRTITDYAWSHNGKQLAISRASFSSDIVLFKGLRK